MKPDLWNGKCSIEDIAGEEDKILYIGNKRSQGNRKGRNVYRMEEKNQKQTKEGEEEEEEEA